MKALKEFKKDEKNLENSAKLEEAKKNMSEFLKDLAKDGKLDNLCEDLKEELQKNGMLDENGNLKLDEDGNPEMSSLTQEQLEKLAESTCEGLQEKMEQMAEALGEEFENGSLQLSQEDMEALRQLLEENPELMEMAGLLEEGEMGEGGEEGEEMVLVEDADGNMVLMKKSECTGGKKVLIPGSAMAKPGTKPGTGAPTRGPGAAPMTFGKESDESLATFKKMKLPPGALVNPDGSITIKEVFGKPSPIKNPEVVKQVERMFKAGGTQSNKRHLHPRHREVIKNYFKNE